jgi:hypothetical protein
MSQVPTDPNISNEVYGLGVAGVVASGGSYAYMVTTKNSITNGGFLVMARTETQ